MRYGIRQHWIPGIELGEDLAMRVSSLIACSEFACTDVRHECYAVPIVEVNPTDVSIMLICSEASDSSALSEGYLPAGLVLTMASLRVI
jgi:hypothetical protein